ncbi:hypothetical protein ACU063_23760 [Paenibacillus sp. M.A.Huq-81]
MADLVERHMPAIVLQLKAAPAMTLAAALPDPLAGAQQLLD